MLNFLFFFVIWIWAQLYNARNNNVIYCNKFRLNTFHLRYILLLIERLSSVLIVFLGRSVCLPRSFFFCGVQMCDWLYWCKSFDVPHKFHLHHSQNRLFPDYLSSRRKKKTVEILGRVIVYRGFLFLNSFCCSNQVGSNSLNIVILCVLERIFFLQTLHIIWCNTRIILAYLFALFVLCYTKMWWRTAFVHFWFLDRERKRLIAWKLWDAAIYD